jgi:hypothetical protein
LDLRLTAVWPPCDPACSWLSCRSTKSRRPLPEV